MLVSSRFVSLMIVDVEVLGSISRSDKVLLDFKNFLVAVTESEFVAG